MKIRTMEKTIIKQSIGIMALFILLTISLAMNIAYASENDTNDNNNSDITQNSETIEVPTKTLPADTYISRETVEETTTTIITEEMTTVEITTVTEPVTEIVTEPIIEEKVIEESEVITPISNQEQYGVLVTKEYDSEKFTRLVEQYAPDLLGIEDSILEIYHTTGISPTFQLAKFCYESGYGKSDLSRNKNNIAGWNAYPSGGLSAYEHATYFDSKGDCVLTVGNSLNTYYIQHGYITIEQISKKYCPVNSYNWANTVTGMMNRIDEIYDSL